MRLLLGLFVCFFAGSLLANALGSATLRGGVGWGFFLLSAGAIGFVGATPLLIRRPWTPENFTRRFAAVWLCFCAGLLLGGWAMKVVGPKPAGISPGQMLIGLLSFQGAALILVSRFLREHQVRRAEAFGFPNRWLQAVLFGVIAACFFYPVGLALQTTSAYLIEHLPHLPIKLHEQQAVQTLRTAASPAARLTLGAGTILVVPAAEEMLFRGILYPWIKQAGFPRLAFWGTSLLFAVVHMNAAIFVPLLVLALILTALYEKTNNLLAPITAHALFNALNLVELYLLEKQMD